MQKLNLSDVLSSVSGVYVLLIIHLTCTSFKAVARDTAGILVLGNVWQNSCSLINIAGVKQKT